VGWSQREKGQKAFSASPKIERKGFVYEEDVIAGGFKCCGFCWVY